VRCSVSLHHLRDCAIPASGTFPAPLALV